MFEVRWQCRAGATLAPETDGTLALVLDGGPTVRLPAPAPLAPHLVRLNEGLAEETVAAGAGDDYVLLAKAFAFMDRLRRHGFLTAGLYWRERRLATLHPRSTEFSVPGVPPSAVQRSTWRLARFAWLRRKGEHWVLEAADAHCEVVIECADLVGWLFDAAAENPEQEAARSHVLGLLSRLGFLDGTANGTEVDTASCRMWEFHDRLFHARSRRIGGVAQTGATFRFGAPPADGDPGMPPAIREPYDGETIELPVPDMRESRPLADVMERRRSQRSMGDPPVSLAQAAALLYRVARVTERLPGGSVRRPYPSGGGMHELEFHLAVRECRDLEPGFYHYRCDAHALTRLPGTAADGAAASMIDDCALTWGQPNQPPQCLMVVSSRLPRVSWKYEGIAYRLSLLGAGVVLQSLYLVVTDLGLHGCAAGSGNPAWFAQATGVSTWAETSIAEFGFGSRPAGAAGGGETS